MAYHPGVGAGNLAVRSPHLSIYCLQIATAIDMLLLTILKITAIIEIEHLFGISITKGVEYFE